MESMAAETTHIAAQKSIGGLLADFLPERELARDLELSDKTLRRWRDEHRGPAWTKVGRRVLYSRKSVIAWLAACEKNPHERDRRYGTRAHHSKKS